MQRVRTFSGQRLKQLREQRRLTQTDLAAQLRRAGFGTTQTTVSRWETDQQPHSPVLPALAEALGVSMDELYADDEDEPSLSSRSLADQLMQLARFAGVIERNPDLIEDILAAEEAGA